MWFVLTMTIDTKQYNLCEEKPEGSFLSKPTKACQNLETILKECSLELKTETAKKFSKNVEFSHAYRNKFIVVVGNI